MTLGCAILTFLYFNWQGLRHHGPLGYLKTFTGPVWWLSWLIGPVEIISATARILSLTVRLWANIFASDLIYMIFLGLLITPVQWGWTKHPVIGIAFAIFPVFIPHYFCWPAHFRFHHSGLRVHRAAIDLHRPGRSRRTLKFAVTA